MENRQATSAPIQSQPPQSASVDFERLGGGVNQAGGRAYNERLTLSLIRLNGPLPKAELARLTRLSAQTMSLIVRSLESDGLVEAQAPLRGRIGQPSVPYALAADGAYSFGVKIGRRSTEVVLCDFIGTIRERARWAHAYPHPVATFERVGEIVASMRSKYPATARYTGIGVAMPFELWKWADDVDAPPGLLDGWRDIDVAARMSEISGLPSLLANDATAACGAEFARNPRNSSADWLYFFIGAFVGGGVVLNGALYQGRRQNAGAVGSMPVFLGGKPSQLIQHASIITLERAMVAKGLDPSILQESEQDWSAIGEPLERWIVQASEALAWASVGGASIVDFQRVVIDGAVPRNVLAQIVKRAQAKVETLVLDGLSPFEIVAGEIGPDARAIGGAMLPMQASFSADQDVLLKT